MVGLHSQAEKDLKSFEDLVSSWPMVREIYMLNGEIDFILKIVAKDLNHFQNFLTTHLTPAPNVANVKTSLSIRCRKNRHGIPFPSDNEH
jgi:DNA-binding Lrp family transcriptional regulator